MAASFQPSFVSVFPGPLGPVHLYGSDLWNDAAKNEALAGYYWAPLRFSADGAIQPLDCADTARAALSEGAPSGPYGSPADADANVLWDPALWPAEPREHPRVALVDTATGSVISTWDRIACGPDPDFVPTPLSSGPSGPTAPFSLWWAVLITAPASSTARRRRGVSLVLLSSRSSTSQRLRTG